MPNRVAPAKINLRLKITGRRSDGYHLLDMVMVRIDLCDEIEFEMTTSGVSIEASKIPPSPPFSKWGVPSDSSNSLWKTAELVRRESGKNFGIRISLKKNIPIAAGLGGGSSDAASLLIGLNQGLGLGWSREKLIQVGLRIGADLPFFLVEGPQRVTGIGEILEPISVPSLPIILINPGFPVSTKEAYRWFDATVDDEVAAGLLKSALPGAAGPSGVPADNENSRFVREGSLAAGALKVVAEAPDDEKSLAATSRIRAGLTEIKTDAIPPLLENDLEEVVISRYPVLAEVKETLVKAGALGALMSGSGGTVFGLFESVASRDRGFDLIVSKKDPDWWLWKGNARG